MTFTEFQLRLRTLCAVSFSALIAVYGAHAQDKVLNLYSARHYSTDEALYTNFTKATGIKINFNEQPDQDAMFAQAKLSLQTGAIDVAEPTVDRIGGWASNGLVQGWDLNKLSLDNYLPGLADGTMGEMATCPASALMGPNRLN